MPYDILILIGFANWLSYLSLAGKGGEYLAKDETAKETKAERLEKYIGSRCSSHLFGC